MKYTSTRDRTISCTFEEAICSGYAPDGGLFVPETLPAVSIDRLKTWARLDYPQLAQSVLRLFVSEAEVSETEMTRIFQAAYRGFADPAHAVPIRKVGSLYVAELFHGPTFCFKDLGMQAVIHLLSLFSTKRNQKRTLLVSTTGDTGPAAVQAVSDLHNPLLTLLVHYPQGHISNFQRQQLLTTTTTDSPQVHVVAFEGGGDDMDLPIKRMLASNPHTWTGVNSYNMGRPLLQMVHYIWTYLRIAEQEPFEIGSETIDIILPTGAMGNLAGGYMAKQMGIPLGKLCSGVNVNDITDRVMRTGAFHKSPVMLKTLSDAINIQIPYNFERLLYYLTDQNDTLVKEWMTQVDHTQKLDLSTEWLTKLQTVFASAQISDDDMCAMTRKVWKEHDYLMDPHTAVAMGAAEKLGYYYYESSKIAVVLATASPCKFEESVTMAVGRDTWQAFETSDHFPASARELLLKTERPPTVYTADPGCSLRENQAKWEEQARTIVATFGEI